MGRAVCNFLRWEMQVEKALAAAPCLVTPTGMQSSDWLRGPLLWSLEYEANGTGKPPRPIEIRRRSWAACNGACHHAGSMRDGR